MFSNSVKAIDAYQYAVLLHSNFLGAYIHVMLEIHANIGTSCNRPES